MERIALAFSIFLIEEKSKVGVQMVVEAKNGMLTPKQAVTV